MLIGRPTKYNPDFHPEEIIRLMKEQGKTAVQVARDWDIDVDTLYEWAKVHKIFSDAFTRAKKFRLAWWEDIGQKGLVTSDDVRFDSRLYGMMMKYSGVNMEERNVAVPELATCKTFSEQATVICGALACGKITPKEAQTMVDVISICAKIEEVTDLRTKLEAIEAHLGKK